MHYTSAHRVSVLAQPTGPANGHLKAYDQGLVRLSAGQKKFSYFEYPAVVLAVLGNLALVEYECANKTTALAFVRNSSLRNMSLAMSWGAAALATAGAQLPIWERVPIRPCSYQQLLKPWLIAIINQKGAWRGIGRRGEIMPTPAEVLADRFVLRRSPRRAIARA